MKRAVSQRGQVRGRDGKRLGRRGGARRNSGKALGSVNEAKRVARAQAARTDGLPHEFLLRWGSTGYMDYVNAKGQKTRTELEPSDRISCMKGCATWYKAPYQARPAPGEQPPTIRVELDEKMIAALAKNQPDKLDVLRDVLRAIGAGGADLAQATSGGGPKADPSRYGKMLDASSDTAGSA